MPRSARETPLPVMTLSLRDRLADYELLLRELRTWCQLDGFGRRAAQAAGYARTIECALAGAREEGGGNR